MLKEEYIEGADLIKSPLGLTMVKATNWEVRSESGAWGLNFSHAKNHFQRIVEKIGHFSRDICPTGS